MINYGSEFGSSNGKSRILDADPTFELQIDKKDIKIILNLSFLDMLVNDFILYILGSLRKID